MFHLVIVEDEPVLRLLWEMAVADWGLPLRVTVLPDGYSALMEISQRVPDLIITDLDMPHIDGRALIVTLAESPAYRDIPVVVVSGSRVADLPRCPSIAACFSKPAPYDAIGDCVTSLLGIKRDLSPT